MMRRPLLIEGLTALGLLAAPFVLPSLVFRVLDSDGVL